SVLNVTTLDIEDTQAPSVPSGLVSSDITHSSFTLSWTESTDNTGVAGYEVFINGNLIESTSSTSITITELTASTIYTVTVRSFDAANNMSELSSPLIVTTGVNGIDNNSGITVSVYPNPATKGVAVTLEG